MGSWWYCQSWLHWELIENCPDKWQTGDFCYYNWLWNHHFWQLCQDVSRYFFPYGETQFFNKNICGSQITSDINNLGSHWWYQFLDHDHWLEVSIAGIFQDVPQRPSYPPCSAYLQRVNCMRELLWQATPAMTSLRWILSSFQPTFSVSTVLTFLRHVLRETHDVWSFQLVHSLFCVTRATHVFSRLGTHSPKPRAGKYMHHFVLGLPNSRWRLKFSQNYNWSPDCRDQLPWR